MKSIDVLIPLLVGLLLVARPQAFSKKRGSAEEVAALYAKLRRLGYALLGVAALYAMIAVFRG